jgi:hypothetical protein
MRVEAIFGNGFKLICPVQSCAQKDSTLPVGQIITTGLRRSTPNRGAFRDRHERWDGMRWTRLCGLTSGAVRGRRSRVVLAPLGWRQVGDDALHRADDGD